MDLLPGERQDLIMSRLDSAGRVIAADLAGEFGISEDTVRRDLRDMAARGLCVRVYGGALPVGERPGTLTQRSMEAVEPKAALARAVVPWIGAGATVFLDAASTNLAIAQALPADLAVTCITNAPQIAATLAARGVGELVVIGGPIDAHVGASIGAQAVREAERLRPDICILGACGVDAEAGISAFDADDAAFKRMIAARSGVTVAPVTNAKLGKVAPFGVLPVKECSVVIVEHDAPEDAVAACEAAGATIQRAEARAR